MGSFFKKTRMSLCVRQAPCAHYQNTPVNIYQPPSVVQPRARPPCLSSNTAIPRRRDKAVSPLPLSPGSAGVSFPYRISYERASKRESARARTPSIRRRRRDVEEDAGLLVTFMDSLSDERDPAMRIDLRQEPLRENGRARGNKPCRAYREAAGDGKRRRRGVATLCPVDVAKTTLSCNTAELIGLPRVSLLLNLLLSNDRRDKRARKREREREKAARLFAVRDKGYPLA